MRGYVSVDSSVTRDHVYAVTLCNDMIKHHMRREVSWPDMFIGPEFHANVSKSTSVAHQVACSIDTVNL